MQAVRSRGQPASARKLRAQGQRTLAKLLEAGLQAFGERGYHAARVDDVVRLADTSHGTFYLYFANKEDLLHALARECAVDMQRLADELGAVTPDAAGRAELRRWVEGFYRTYTRYGAVIRVWTEGQTVGTDLTSMGKDAFASLASTLGSHLPDRGAARPDLTPVLLIALVERFTYFVSSRRRPVDEDRLLDDLAALVQRGFF
jgi:AcrR family transcriptional regulator